MKQHKHAEIIKAWADGQEVQVMTSGGWDGVGLSPSWLDSNEYRVKPAAPKWPQTTMINADLAVAFDSVRGVIDGLRAVANGVIEHECSNGALVPADKANENAIEHYQRGIREGRCQEWDRRNSGGIHNRVGAQIGQSIGQAQYADAVARGLPK